MVQKVNGLLQAQAPDIETQDGQSLVEYALIIMLVALIVFAILSTLGQTLITVYWDRIVNELIPAMGG